MQAYFDGRGVRSSGVTIATIFMFLLGLSGVLLAALVLLGWIALGERININRRDINFIEWVVIVISLLFGLGAWRAFWGMSARERSGWVWAQWMSFGGIVAGLGITASELMPQIISAISSLQVDPLQPVVLVPGLVLLGMSLLAYRYVTRDVIADDAKVSKLQGAYTTAKSDLTPVKRLRFQLAESPSAGAIIGFIAVVFVFSVSTDLFLAPTSIASVLTNISTKGIVAIGVTILMISGEFDLSVGSQLGAVSTIFMLAMTEGILGFPPLDTGVSMIVAILFGLTLGFVNGTILVSTGIPSFIVTLGTLLAYRALPLVLIAGGRILRYRDFFDDFPQMEVNHLFMIALGVFMLLLILFMAYRALPTLWRSMRRRWAIQHENGDFGTTGAIAGTIVFLIVSVMLLILAVWALLVIWFHLERGNAIFSVGVFDLANGRWGFTLSEVTRGLLRIEIPTAANFRNSIMWWFVLVLIFYVVLMKTRYGNAVFAVGGNPGAARAQGINVRRIKVFNFMLVSFLVSIAAILEVARNPGVDPLKGELWELEVIAMTVIGGALLSGGYGSVVGTMLGSLIFGMLQTGLVLVGMNARLFSGVVGIMTIIAVVLNTAVRGRKI